MVLVFAGCGRIAFDPLTPPDAPPDAATDATRTACDGVAPAGCIVADCPAVPSCVLYCSYAQATWNGARVECQARGGDLASVSTQAALACIVATRGASPGAWIGLTQGTAATPDTGWTWLSGAAFAMTGWNTGEPNDDGSTPGIEDMAEQCGALVPGGFNDGPCTDVGHWACQVP